MANLDFTLKRNNGTGYDALLPTTHIGKIYTDNTLSTTLQSVLDAKIPLTQKGAALGVATLDSSSKLNVSQIPSWLMSGGPRQLGTFGAAGLDLADFASEIGTLLSSGENHSNYYGAYYTCTASGNVTWTNTAYITYVLNPGDEGDTVSPVTLEVGDMVMLTKYEAVVDPMMTTFTFAVINNTYGNASTAAYGVARLSDATLLTGMSGSDVITEGVLFSLVGSTAGKLAAGNHDHDLLYQPLSTNLSALAGLEKVDGNFIVGNGATWTVESGATARASLGLTIGTHVQAYDAGLTSIAGLTTAADKMLYTTASDTYATTDLGATGKSLIAAGTAAIARTVLSLVPGTDILAYDADLATIGGLAGTAGYLRKTGANAWELKNESYQPLTANLTTLGGLAVTDGNFIVGNGTTWIVESGATARTSLDVYSTTEVNDLLVNRPELYYDTTTGVGTGDFIIDLD